MRKTIGELHALLIEYEKGLPKKAATLQVMAIQGHYKRNCPTYLAELIKKKNQVGTASSSGGEYISQEFKDYLKACGIVQHLTPPYTPQHNRVSERRNHTLLDMIRSMMNLTTLPLFFWDYALETTTRIINMVPTKKVDKTSYELWYVKAPNLSYLKIWGCDALVKRDTPDRLQQRVVVRYVEFLEKNIISQKLGDLNEPDNYKAVLSYLKSDKWVDAMNAKMQSMKDNQVWCLVGLPPNCKTVESKWLFTKKTNMDGIVHTYKARLVVKGYTQTYE
nr:retrotransposon protein, putative, Ty1-copia subclass [Tanacetum cinerariifolium]